MVLLDQAFYKRDIPVTDIAWYMHTVLPKKYSIDTPKGVNSEVLDKELLKQEIIFAGSSAYECLIKASEKSNYQELVNQLTDHTVKQLYRWVWIWSEDNSVMRRGKSWFTTKEECLNEGKKNGPSYVTFDGPGCPDAMLSVESVCSCFVHMADEYDKLISPPCLCFTIDVPPQFQGLSEIEIDGLKIMKIPVIDFGCIPKYEYVIKNTGEIFTSHEKDIYKAYFERHRSMIIKSKH